MACATTHHSLLFELFPPLSFESEAAAAAAAAEKGLLWHQLRTGVHKPHFHFGVVLTTHH
jgi:hypothetical protein